MSHRSINSFRERQQLRIETESSDIYSIGDIRLVEQNFIEPRNVRDWNDYFYMIYIFLLTIFYISYMIRLFRSRVDLLDEDEQYFSFFSDEREIPRLLWLRKGYRLR